MGGKSGGGSQTTTQSSAPPEYALGAFKAATKAAQSNYNNQNLAYYGGNTVADFSPESEQALQQTTTLAENNPLIDAGQRQSLATLNGDYLNSNPYTSALIEQTNRDTTRDYQTATLPSISSAFTSAGRYGSNAYANAQDSARANLATALGDNATNINYQNYAAERGYQNSAMNNAAALDAQKYAPSQVLAQVGALRDQQAQAKIDADIEKYNYTRDLPTQKLNTFIAQLTGATNGYGTQISTQQQQSSGGGLSSLLGAATSLGGAYLSTASGAGALNSALGIGGTSGIGASKVPSIYNLGNGARGFAY